MLDKERRKELNFLLRIGSHIKIHADAMGEDNFSKDYYTLRELVDNGVFKFLYLDPGNSITLEVEKQINISKPDTDFEFVQFKVGEIFNVKSDEFTEKSFYEM